MKIKVAHSQSVKEIQNKLDTDPERGLSEKEVSQRLKEYGYNKLEEHERVSIWQILLDQVNTPVIYLLGAAAILSFAFGDIPEGSFIIVVILINAAIGFYMEYRARESMQALRQMDKLQAHVIREGEKHKIDAAEIVPGDLLVVEPGDLIAADARLIDTSEVEINESALTGESVPVSKAIEPVDENTALADRSCMVYKGTAATRGKARGIVVATGMDTEIGAISEMVQSAEGEDVPLDKKLAGLTRRLIWVVLGMAAVLGAVTSVTGQDLYTIVQTAIAWAIAATPEGLPIVASIALARGMLRLADHQVIVKKLSAVEALGETNVIFTDKTGTLTENKLTVKVLANLEEVVKVEDAGLFENPEKVREDPYLNHFFLISVLANDAQLDAENDENNQGDPLEIALLRFGQRIDEERMADLCAQERIAEDPFDSEDMVMGTVYRFDDDHYYIAGKGAAGPMLERCSKILRRNGETEPLEEEDREKWQQKNDELAERGLRTLVFACRETEEPPEGVEEEDFLYNLTLIGLMGFIDPPRKDVAAAIDTCHEAGIEVVMVTGDHPGTARNVAEEIHLVDGDGAKDLSSEEIAEVSDSEITKASIFSRVSPGEKLDIVEKFQKQGKIVGMTGDGVNDAPALKKADIGIAMGRRGTEVAKETADLVLKDDSFPSIIQAIREGRIVFSNIRKFIVYQLSYHLGEIFVIAAISFSLLTLPLLPLQLLFLNILSDVFPALALGIGEGREGVMKEPPKDPDEPFLHRASWVSIVTFAVVIATSVSGAYLWAHLKWGLSHEMSNDVAFFSLAFAQLLHVFDMRDADEPIFFNQVTRNKYIWMALAFCTAALAVAYLIPGLRELLGFEQLGMREWILVAIASVLPIIISQILKAIFKLF